VEGEAVLRYVERRLEELNRWFERNSSWIMTNEAFTPEERDARMADLWVRITDRRDELRRVERHFR